MTQAILVKAFTKDPTQGNPAGIILHADHLTEKEMLMIAKKLGFSESAFVQKSSKADFKIRFFTPTQEVDLCGHGTIATFHTLVNNKLILFNDANVVHKTQETKAGILPVTCYSNGLIMMTQKKPQFSEHETDRKRIAQLLSLQEDDLLNFPIQTVSTGSSKLIIPIKSLDLLFAIKPDFAGITTYSKEKNVSGFYPFTLETKEKDSDMHARMFDPIVGIDEDPITGIAAGALACYVTKNGVLKKHSCIVEQGYVMNKSGKILVDLQEGVKVGGYAVEFDQKKIA